MDLVYENNSVKFFFDEKSGIFKAVFIGKVNMENTVTAFNYVLSNPNKFSTKAIISDLTKLQGTFTMLLDYLDEKLYPYLSSKGVLCDAIVLNNDAFTKFSVIKLEKTISNFIIKSFTSLDAAEKWVQKIIEDRK